ncbi:MAG TPA: bidirectional hydrogenase complex protein HoxE [Anaerolineales bacterium]|nr:bidirectional hydrogenase complex protein HoxE [Anaerolineales bacterium]
MTGAQGHPSGDDRYLIVDRTMKRFRFEKDALLEVLNTAQETFGYLSQDLLVYIASQLTVPLSRVYGVATFYHMFTFSPRGEHNCTVCTGTACHVKGSAAIVEGLAAAFAIQPGQTTPDGRFSLVTARCLGCCGLAPVIVLDGEVHARQTLEESSERVQAVLNLERAGAAAG